MPSWNRRAGSQRPLRQGSAEWTEEMPFSVYLNHGKEPSPEFSHTFTKCLTPRQAIELIRSGLEKLWFKNTFFFDRKKIAVKKKKKILSVFWSRGTGSDLLAVPVIVSSEQALSFLQVHLLPGGQCVEFISGHVECKLKVFICEINLKL